MAPFWDQGSEFSDMRLILVYECSWRTCWVHKPRIGLWSLHPSRECRSRRWRWPKRPRTSRSSWGTWRREVLDVDVHPFCTGVPCEKTVTSRLRAGVWFVQVAMFFKRDHRVFPSSTSLVPPQGNMMFIISGILNRLGCQTMAPPWATRSPFGFLCHPLRELAQFAAYLK